MVHLLPHWNWTGKEGQPIKVWVHSNATEVELFCNGKSQGKKAMPHLGHLEWDVPYEPGALEAIGTKDGSIVARDRVDADVNVPSAAAGTALPEVSRAVFASSEIAYVPLLPVTVMG